MWLVSRKAFDNREEKRKNGWKGAGRLTPQNSHGNRAVS